MSKKNRAKSKAKRFGEGSAKPIVSAATYGVGGNAFAQAIADPVSTCLLYTSPSPRDTR